MHICAKGAGSKEMSEQYCFLWLIIEMYRIDFYANCSVMWLENLRQKMTNIM